MQTEQRHDILHTPKLESKLARRDVLKLGSTLTAASLIAPFLASCGKPLSSIQSKTLQVYINAGHTYDAYQQVIDKFQQDNAGWKVNLQPYQWPDMRTKILADFAAGNVPDLVEEPGGWVPEFAVSGRLRSLQPYIKGDGKSMGFPDDWQSYTVTRNTINNEVYGIQLHLTCMLLFYNKDMLSQAGITQPPATWDEFLAAAKATAKKNVYGFAPNQDPGYAWPWFIQNNVQYYDPVKKVVSMDTSDAYAALQFQSDLIHKYKVAPVPIASADYEGPQKLFSAQRAAMILTGPWDIKPILEGSPDLHWGIAPALKGQKQATVAAGTSLFIPKAAKNPDMAWELLKRLVAPDVELAVTKEANMPMPRKSWVTNPSVQSMPYIDSFAQGLKYALDPGADLNKTGKSGAVTDLFNKAYQDALYRNLSASQVLKTFVQQANAALAQ
ncbi:MAG TPA: sugar ABC transporter substrate-binding protein [Ktedonobacteraceae bacterium]